MGTLLPGLAVMGLVIWVHLKIQQRRERRQRADADGPLEAKPFGHYPHEALLAWSGLTTEFKRMARMALIFLPLLLILVVTLRALGDAGVISVHERIEPFTLLRRRPTLLLVIMIGYPLFSVIPQELLFRVWFCRRYGTAFGDPSGEAGQAPVGLIVANALAFGWAHVIFENVAAVLLTTIGGALFCWTYLNRGSLLAAWLEHAVYGCWIFIVGLGWWFYGGSV